MKTPVNHEPNVRDGGTPPKGTRYLLGLTFALVTAAIAAALLVSSGSASARAKEPVQVALRPDTTATLAAAAVSADSKGTGTFKGVVTFKGTPPKSKLILGQGDPGQVAKPEDRGICAAEDHFSEELLINEKADNGVANVFIYLQKPPAGYTPPPPPDEPAVFDQKGCQFVPHALMVRCKQKVLVKSGDNLVHNTHTTPLRNDGFNKAIKVNDRDGEPLTYGKPEPLPVNVTCDFHKWMKAYHLPLDHPFMALTDADGKFEIKDLPPGEHTFVIWHEQGLYLDRKHTVKISADKETEEKLSFTAAQFKAGS
jgi:hypothetical protein